MNRPESGRAPIKKPSNKKFNNLKHERGSKKGKKKSDNSKIRTNHYFVNVHLHNTLRAKHYSL